MIFSAIGVCITLQALSIIAQYIMAVALFKGVPPIGPGIFFLYIPLIWVAALVPSLGGLGVREFSYVLLFSASMGKEKSFALALLVLFSLILQAFIGAIIFFTFKARKYQTEN